MRNMKSGFISRSSRAGSEWQIVALLLLVCSVPPTRAEQITAAEASQVAHGWTLVMARLKGQWGGSLQPQVGQVRELKRANRTVGYYCPVLSGGYVVVSTHKELPPIKAYATTGALDPQLERGMPDLIKLKLHHLLAGLERRLGPLEKATPAQLKALIKTDYRPTWQALQQVGASGAIQDSSPAQAALLQYQAGRVLLSTAWNQPEPYNDLCPPGPTCAHTLVGCTAVAAAQIMRFWSWPPYGESGVTGSLCTDPYDWTHMPDVLYARVSSAEEIAAVAELCYEAGRANEANYGCDETSAVFSCPWGVIYPFCRSMEWAFGDTFRYQSENTIERNDYTAQEWFDGIKAEINQYQPVNYAISNHVVVVDGWQEVAGLRQYHVNYGWGPDNRLTWFTEDQIPPGDLSREMRHVNLHPNASLGAALWNIPYGGGSFPYCYVNQDVVGTDAIFSAGAQVQFLPGTRMSNVGTAGNTIYFFSDASHDTRLFANGDTSKGIVVRGGGSILVHGSGQLALRPLVPPRQLTVVPSAFSIVVSWDLPYTGADQIQIQRKEASGYYFSTIATVDPTPPSFTHASPSGTYIYRARSLSNGRCSEWSQELGAIMP